MTFNALVLSKENDKQKTEITKLQDNDLMEGDTLIEVAASTLNYKDGLALTGQAPVVRRWPMIPGIDLAGRILKSTHTDFSPGDKIIINGFGLGETHYGGYAQKARVKSKWLVPLPPTFDEKQAMAIGTAGYTAMLCVMALERHGLSPKSGDVLVTGAAGGVGSIAIAILAKRGFSVIASTGRQNESAYLKKLGAKEILPREELSKPGPPLGKTRFAAAIDVAGGQTLVNTLAQIAYGGCVAACGLAESLNLPASVAPFILRGVSLAGIDSVMAPQTLRRAAWTNLARDITPDMLQDVTTHTTLAELPSLAPKILAGQVRGRVVVNLNG